MLSGEEIYQYLEDLEFIRGQIPAEPLDQKTIRQQFIKLSKQYHPDKNPDNSAAQEKFKLMKSAYEALSREPDVIHSQAFKSFFHAPSSQLAEHNQVPALEVVEYNDAVIKILDDRVKELEQEQKKSSSSLSSMIRFTPSISLEHRLIAARALRVKAKIHAGKAPPFKTQSKPSQPIDIDKIIESLTLDERNKGLNDHHSREMIAKINAIPKPSVSGEPSPPPRQKQPRF